MTGKTSEVGSAGLAGEVVREAWRTYTGHLPVIVGLSLVGSAQRALVQYVGDDLSPVGAFALEGLTWGCRVLLAVLLWRWVIGADERLRGVRPVDGLRRLGRYARRHGAALLLQLAGFAVAVLVLDTVPDLLIAPLVAPAAAPTYWAV